MSDLESTLRNLVRLIVREELTPAPVADDYLSTRGAAQHAKVAEGTIRRWVRQGKLHGHHAGRLIRISRAELEKFMSGRPTFDGSETPEQIANRKYC